MSQYLSASSSKLGLFHVVNLSLCYVWTDGRTYPRAQNCPVLDKKEAIIVERVENQ